MKIFFMIVTSVLVLMGLAFAQEKVVWIASIRGTIDPASSNYLKSAIREAEKDQAQALVVELDTPGGLLTSVREMAQTVDQASIPVVVYVTPAGASATSAGALLMLSSHLAAMAPGSNIGAAHPVDSSGQDVKGAMGEKVVNDTAAFARGLAELRGRNLELAQQVVSKSKSLTAKEAYDKNFIEILATDRVELFQKLEGRKVKIRDQERVIRTEGAIVKTAEMTLGQTILHYLANPNIAAVLMTLAMLLIYVELSNPGITIAGVLGGIGLLWMLDPAETDLRISPHVWVPIAVGLGSAVALLVCAVVRMRKLTQTTLAQIGGGGGSGGLAGYFGQVEKVGAEGRRGKVHFRGEVWNFESKEPLKTGDWVQAERVVGLRVIVKRKD